MSVCIVSDVRLLMYELMDGQVRYTLQNVGTHCSINGNHTCTHQNSKHRRRGVTCFSHPFMVCCDEDGEKDIFRVFPIFSNIEWKKMDLIAGGRC